MNVSLVKLSFLKKGFLTKRKRAIELFIAPLLLVLSRITFPYDSALQCPPLSSLSAICVSNQHRTGLSASLL